MIFALADPTIGFRQKLVNGNEPQRAAQVKIGEKSPKNVVFWPFSTQNRDFRPENRHFRIFGPFFDEILTLRHKVAKDLAVLR